jgi:hypothetical protein
VSHPHRNQRERQRQGGQQVPRREPEAEHRGRDEGGHEQLRAERGRAQRRGSERRSDLRHRLHEPLAIRVPQPPESREGQQEHGRPAQQPVLPVDEQRDEPVGALEIAAGKVGFGGALARRIGGVGRGTAVERFVEGHVKGHREQRQLHRSHGKRPARRPPEFAGCEGADQESRRHELGAEPRQRAEQREAEERLHSSDALAEAQRQQRRPGERGARGELGVDRAPVGQERGAEPHGQPRAERPRVRGRPHCEPVSERHRQSGDRREEQLHRLHAADGVGRRDQEREADSVRLVQAALGEASMAVELVRIELVVRARGVLVAHVHVAVLNDRLGGQQVVRLIPAVVGGAERMQPERGRVAGEQQQPEGEGATHRRRTLAAHAYATTAISSW